MNQLRLQSRINSGSVQVEEMEPEFVLMIGMVEFESAQILIIHGDAVHAPRAGGGDRHHSTVDLVSFMA